MKEENWNQLLDADPYLRAKTNFQKSLGEFEKTQKQLSALKRRIASLTNVLAHEQSLLPQLQTKLEEAGRILSLHKKIYKPLRSEHKLEVARTIAAQDSES